MAEGSVEERLKTIDSQTLTPLVCEALNSEELELVTWKYEAVHGGTGSLMGDGLYRFLGMGLIEDRMCEWSLMLKVIRADPELDSFDPSTWYYWKREALSYQSGLLEELPGGLVAPHCFGVDEIADDEIWMWLEEIPAETESEWSLAQYAVAAEHLGQFNGAYLTGRALPSHDWFSHGRIHEWLAEAQGVIPRLHEYMFHPFARSWLADDAPERLKRLWSRREELLDGIANLPLTLCHHDAFRRNLMSGQDRNGHDITYALDWSMLGPGVIGEEIATMFSVSLQFLDHDARFARQLDEAVFGGYLAGLRGAGWNGKAELVRFGFTASAALFMGLGAAGSFLPWIIDENNQVIIEQLLKQPLDKVAEPWSKMQFYLFDLADEALALLEVIN